MASSAAETAAPALPPAIQRLEDAVVHRIAAGEVVQRPASALKEMVENSLDAGAKHITVVVKEGGLKYLQIQDDGCGVRLDDLPILCHRHTTSKLRAFEDLETISTLGFRGEALASISFVSHVTVTTMTAAMQHGYRVKYSDGEMLPPGPKPVAAVPGTSIIVEDMFYNMLARRRSFKPGPEEHNLLQDVLQRYAIYKAGSVGFTLKRQGEARSDLHTLPTASRLDVIRGLFGPELATSLLPLQLTGGSGDVSDDVTLDGPMGFTAEGYVSNLTYLGRRSVLVLFINGRPVEQGQLRRAIESVYTAQNPKANKPWVFLDLRLPPRHVEVNMHPTKKEVGFLHQQDVIDSICRAVEQVLTASMHTRTFAVNRPVALAAAAAGAPAAAAEGPGDAADADGDADMTDGAAATQQQQAQVTRRGSGPLKPLNGPSRQPSPGAAAGGGSGAQGASKQPSQPAYRPEKLVRTDHRTQSIEGFLVSQASAAAMATAAAAAGSAKRRRSAAAAAAGSSERPRPGSGLGAEQGDEEGFGGDALFSNASLHLQAAAAEEAAAAAELAAAASAAAVPGGELQQLQRQEALLRPVAQPRLPAVQTQLSSIWELLGEVQDSVHGELQQLFKSHTWVGMADYQLALLQHGTRLYLIDMAAITRDLFYQLLLNRWEAVQVMQLLEPLHVGALMGIALQQEEALGKWQPEPGSTREELCELVQALLAQKADMLQEYVGLTFQQKQQDPQAAGLDQAGATQQQHQQQQQDGAQHSPQEQQQQQQPGLYLTGLPSLLEGYLPDLSRLPQLILQLARDVEWETEKECFKTLAAALAGLYALQPLLPEAACSKGELALAQQAGSSPHTEAPGSGTATGSAPATGVAAAEAAAAGASAGQAAAASTENDTQDAAAEPMDVDTDMTQQQQQPLHRPPQAQGDPLEQSAAGAVVTSTNSSKQGGSSLMLSAGHRSQAQREWLLRHVVMPAVKSMYRPPKSRARDGSVLLLTSMEKLYRVFERCGW